MMNCFICGKVATSHRPWAACAECDARADEKNKARPPERDLAADLHALAQVHTVFAATVTPLMQELRMLIRNQDTKIAMLEHEVATLRMAIPVRIA